MIQMSFRGLLTHLHSSGLKKTKVCVHLGQLGCISFMQAVCAGACVYTSLWSEAQAV